MQNNPRRPDAYLRAGRSSRPVRPAGAAPGKRGIYPPSFFGGWEKRRYALRGLEGARYPGVEAPQLASIVATRRDAVRSGRASAGTTGLLLAPIGVGQNSGRIGIVPVPGNPITNNQ